MTYKPPKPQKEPEAKPGVEVGDHLYVHHKGQPHTGQVKAHGRHGVTVDIEGEHHKVKWEHVLGHKSRALQRYEVVDQGEDGMLVKDGAGRRRFIATPNEAKEDPMVAKSHGHTRPVMLFMKASVPGSYAGAPGLQKKQVTDKNGVQTTKWVKTDKGGPPLQVGQYAGWQNGDHKGHGEVKASGAHGITAHDASNGVHRVPHENVTHKWGGDGAPDHSPHEPMPAAKKEVKAHEGDPDSFNARAFAAEHDDPSATADSIVAGFGPEAKAKIDAAGARAGSVKQTIDTHHDGKQWNEERAKLHRKLMFEGVEINGKKVPGLLAAERIKAATPAPGEAPTFIALGGRGGSGKSSLNGRVYEESRAIVLDADHIKGMLPEYEGWNAHQVHEESSSVLESVLGMAKILGVNVVLDATMKTGKSIESKVDEFKTAGFRTEAHYMHLPRQEATKRAIGRFLGGGEKGRYVPPEVVLGNTKNEENFDNIKGKVDAWSFHDNSGEKGSGPKLIAQKGEPGTVAKKPLIKSEQRPIMILWKTK